MTLTTTFRKLRSAGACKPRYKFLRDALKGVKDNEPINLLTILEINGLDDALWALNATIEKCDQVARLMAADFAETALPIWRKYYPNDKRPELAIQAARDFAHGRITDQQRAAAWAAAWAAARASARDAARDAAGDAARASAGATARASARDAARDAAGDAAWASARDAARASAGDAAWAVNREIFIRHLQPELIPCEVQP